LKNLKAIVTLAAATATQLAAVVSAADLFVVVSASGACDVPYDYEGSILFADGCVNLPSDGNYGAFWRNQGPVDCAISFYPVSDCGGAANLFEAPIGTVPCTAIANNQAGQLEYPTGMASMQSWCVD
jgi:hypothetical protein